MATRYDKFMVAPQGFSEGLETDKQPWLISDQSYAGLNNAYVFRGRTRKRFGSYLMGNRTPQQSRLRINLGNTNGSGGATYTVPGNEFNVGQMFTVGTDIFTVVVLGTPGTLLASNPTTTGTYDTTSGQVILTGSTPPKVAVPVYFYPATPVMGITQYEDGSINNRPTVAFDTQFAYLFPGGGWSRSVNVDDVTPTWQGNNDQFFWTTNWRGIAASTTLLFVTNFNAPVGAASITNDPMYYWDQTTWTAFTPAVLTNFSTSAVTTFVQTARIIIQFQGCLLLLNTIEQTSSVNTQYRNRCRFSHIGSPVDLNSFLEPNNKIAGPLFGDGGGFIDATTQEEIISARTIKNRLIVYFERSTWEIVYTNNKSQPFLWQKINSELGSEALLSTVSFDTAVLAIGNTGVHACNGANTERIDNKIPQKIFQLNSSPEGVSRVVGIRDYYVEMVYWSLPSDNQSSTDNFPNKVLTYNYENASWSFNDDSITAFGYFEQQTDLTWQDANFTWESSDASWTSGVESSNFRQILGGNQEGFMFVVDTATYRNAAALQITNITADPNGYTRLTIIDHNIPNASYIMIENVVGATAYNNVICKVLKVLTVDGNPDDTVLVDILYSAGYLGGGTAARVSNIQILSKQWNPYVNQGSNVLLGMIDFYVAKTDAGAISVDYYASSTTLSLIDAGMGTKAILGNSNLSTAPYALAPIEEWQQRLWHPIYFQSVGECIQIYMSFNDTQMRDASKSQVNFELAALILYCIPITRIT